MIDLQEIAPGPRKRAKTLQYDVMVMRPGRWVTAPSGAWPDTSLRDPDAVVIGHFVSSHYDAVEALLIADWLADETGVPAEAPARAPIAEEVEDELRELCTQVLDTWVMVGGHQGSTRRAAAHPMFQIIRQIAPIATEMMIERLREEPNPLWIWALGELTGTDPAQGLTTIPEAAAAWVLWADTRDLA